MYRRRIRSRRTAGGTAVLPLAAQECFLSVRRKTHSRVSGSLVGVSSYLTYPVPKTPDTTPVPSAPTIPPREQLILIPDLVYTRYTPAFATPGQNIWRLICLGSLRGLNSAREPSSRENHAAASSYRRCLGGVDARPFLRGKPGGLFQHQHQQLHQQRGAERLQVRGGGSRAGNAKEKNAEGAQG